MRRLTPGLALGAAAATIVAGVPVAAAAAAAAPQAAGATAPTALPASSPGADHDALGLPAAQTLVPRSVVTDPDGTRFVRYERTWKGLRVVGGDLVLEKSPAGALRQVRFNAGHRGVGAATTTPKVARSAAESAAQQRSKATAEKSRGELVVWAGSGTPRLAYDVVTTGVKADQTPSRLHTIVDAGSGAVVTSWDEIVTGTGNSMYSGTVTLHTVQSGSTWQLKDSHGNYTTDLNGSTSSTASGTLFTDADNVWGTGSASSRQTAGVDAQYGAEMTYDFYDTVLGRAGIWDNGQGARSRVHYGNSYVNAFWDGSQMTYGDGSGNTHPLTSLDVAAHEMSHGVTENTAGLAYSGEAGGLNEATSDIFGTAVEFYANNATDTGDYLIGEKIDINGDGSPLRYMDKPSKDGASQDCWSSSTKNLDPHYSSGPLNHWFYLASEGSGAKTINGVSYNSPTCNGSTVTGTGREKVEKIWYRTLATKLTSSATYAAARNGAIASAKELYGADSSECTAVAAAFSAINVAAGSEACGGGSTEPPPTSGNLLQNPGFESGATVWTGTSGPITSNTGRPARTGSWKMWLGGNGRTTTETESQTVTIPSSASAATLSFWMRVDTSETTSSRAYDTMKAQVVSGGSTSTLATYSNLDATGTYVKKSFDVSSYAGRSVTVKFLLSEDVTLQTSFVVDDTSLATS
ncbi:M4 family metallopeptidase [Phycicoccus endophyticus]|uniref:Neutral metalloproteinase n=1 Tax=Phycicoccus endophyticus TaxID=1690220 RepID=A0A7G9R2P6_9MICO|nr:M4 family metallopeptidase [Phycicoccus endophyticus]NHI20338.1 M4 family metallopeptidase [Phycicoccus endophyticus]QNN49871.1 M4 family metallopeptidase [Phycicoccus endophyticus]GGL30013.1 hypothetical protein GCM10012283_10520 [Phycicoccus endophyticus]